MNIRPLPKHIGKGFTIQGEADINTTGYRCEELGIYRNFYFTTENYAWPQSMPAESSYVIDGFSPNLNKALHVGHLRNFCVALSLSRLLGKDARMVAMLGAAIGENPGALDSLKSFFAAHEYTPELYKDLELPAPNLTFQDGKGEQEGAKVFGNPSVIVIRSDGRPTYAYYDLALADFIQPTHYITGAEQKEYFQSLGLNKGHLSMGLVLGMDGKKIKSRTGDALSLDEALEMIEHALQPSEANKDIAWNIACGNFLMAARGTNVKFDPEQWIQVSSPGMYITYTYARLCSALKDAVGDELQVTDADVDLLGQCSYFDYAHQMAVTRMDPAPMAHYAYDLATEVTNGYHSEKVVNGRPGFVFAMRKAEEVLRKAMLMLGMIPLSKV